MLPTLVRTSPQHHDVAESVISSLEFVLQTLVLPIPNVKHVRGLVQGVTPSPDGQRIDSVQYKPVDATGVITLPCSFFADCTGPACGAMKWLEQAQGATWKQPKKSAYGTPRNMTVSILLSAILQMPSYSIQARPYLSPSVSGRNFHSMTTQSIQTHTRT